MIKPLNKKIVLTPSEKDKTTASGIILLHTEDQRVSVYDVVHSFEGAQVKEGQQVICSEYCGFDLEDQGEKYKIVDEESLLGIYEN